ncbi:uncharacterized protein LOC106462018 isoform X2 [Limulus polyphemus]|uniref:Uncharacterized protein LOC106462018 isoform X2 n=1 Tax=Limulus polyphemus TaxID=6850 RepID=A0ABM1SMI1_LIMPO|nr:uncharacterized protein LOC106462018 isoform X2 [Limulus polyphemus]
MKLCIMNDWKSGMLSDGGRRFRWRHRARHFERKNLTCIADDVPSVLEASFTNCTANQPSFVSLSSFLQIFECVFKDFGLLDQNGIIIDGALGSLSGSDLNATLTFVLNNVIGKGCDILQTENRRRSKWRFGGRRRGWGFDGFTFGKRK